jgi:hypothetical protein
VSKIQPLTRVFVRAIQGEEVTPVVEALIAEYNYTGFDLVAAVKHACRQELSPGWLEDGNFYHLYGRFSDLNAAVVFTKLSPLQLWQDHIQDFCLVAKILKYGED